MAISFVGLSAAASSSVALPTFQVGDLAIVYAFRDGSVTPPDLATGWTDIISGGSNTCSQRAGWRNLVGSDTDTGTWTNATELQVMVLRGHNAASPIGDFDGDTTNNSNFVDYIGLPAMVDTGGTSWIVGMAAHRNATDVNVPGCTPMVKRSGSIGTMGAHTLANANIFETLGYDAAVNSSTGAWRSVTVEVRAGGLGPQVSVIYPTTTGMRW